MRAPEPAAHGNDRAGRVPDGKARIRQVRPREVRERLAPDRGRPGSARLTTEAMRGACGRVTAAGAGPMPDGVPGRTARPNVSETRAVARTVRENREGTPATSAAGPPTPTSRGPTRSHGPSRGLPGDFATQSTSPPRSSPGWEACRSTPSIELRPSPRYPPETPKSPISRLSALTPSPSAHPALWRSCCS